MKIQKLTLSAITSLILVNTYSLAKTVKLDPVVVSSDFRSKTLSKTSKSMTVIGEDKLLDKASLAFENIVGETPNVNFTVGGSRAHYLQIRGIGERSQFEAPVNPSVGLILDGIDISDTTLALTMFDINQIEILKGPQGTTFGSNGMAGVVNVTSKEPTEETQGHIEATVGNYNTKAGGFAVGGTILENKLLGRISAYKNTSDGYINNKYLNRDDTQDIDELTIKTALKYLVSDNHTIDFNFMHVGVDNGYDGFSYDNSRNTTSDQPGRDTLNLNAYAIKSTYQINDKMHLVSKASYSNSNSIYSYDEDWTFVNAFSGSYVGFDEYIRDKKKVDLDLRLVSDENGKIFNDSTAWTFGVYYKKQNEDLKRNYTGLTSQYQYSFDTENKAIYGQLDTALTNKLTLTTGLRVEKWEADFDDSDNLNIDTNETLLGGKLGLSYQVDENNLYYITLSKGYKPGGVNPNNQLSNSEREFKTEHLWNLDLGKNFTVLNGKLKNRINFFYGLRRDQQVKTSTVIGHSFIDMLANASKSHYYGVELQTNYYPNDDLHLFASLGLLKSKFDEFDDPRSTNSSIKNREPAQSPKYQYNIGFDYMLSDNLQFKTNLEGKDSYYFSNSHNAKSDAYALLNSSISYIRNKWTLTLWGRNLTDESYQTRGFYFNNGLGTNKYTQQGNPRTFGLTLAYDF